MAILKFLPTVKTPKVVIIAAALLNAANALELADMLCTSGNDSTHMTGSKHYTDEALDFRTRHLTPEQKHLLQAAVTARLGADYDVILESEGLPHEHLHVEHDPKRPNAGVAYA